MASGEGDQQSVEQEREPINILSLLDDVDLFKQASGLMTIDRFVEACKERGLNVFEEELEYYEQRGLLYPLLRIPRLVQWHDAQGHPVDIGEGDTLSPGAFRRYHSYLTDGENLRELREEGLLIRASAETYQPWSEYRDTEANYQLRIDTYYVLYQILQVHWIKQHVTVEETYRRSERDSDDIVKVANVLSDRFPSGDYAPRSMADLDELVALLLVIQNRYRPGASGILSGYRNQQDYQRYEDAFSPEAAWAIVPIPLEELRTMRWLLCHRAREIDPLENWHDLVGFVGAFKRWKLRGTALLAQELYTIIEMLSRFLSDLAEQRGLTEQEYSCLSNENYEMQMYGRRVNHRDFDILEQILTDYDLNPRPKVLFIVEGETEAAAIPIICEAMQLRLATFGIELHNIAGADKHLEVLTRYAAPPRLSVAIEPGVYAAVRQTRVYALFDRENRWRRDEKLEAFLADWRATITNLLPDDLSDEAKEQIAGRSVTVERWSQCFEFDNFTDDDLAEAISDYARTWGWPEITAAEVASYRADFPKRSLSMIVAHKVRAMRLAGVEVPEHRDFKWDKIAVGKMLAARLANRISLHMEDEPPEAPIVAILQRIVGLALESWP